MLAIEEEGEADRMEEGWKKDDVNRRIEFPHWRAARRKFPADCFFFSAGNLERELLAKQVSLSITEEEKLAISRLEEEEILRVCCPIVGCGAVLNSLSDLESHYAVRHTATCSVCSNVFPTTRLLDLHVSETHDSFFKAKVACNYQMYECLVESCSAKFQSDSRRLQHLVDKHHFPRTFRFHSSKHLSQKQRRRHKQHAYKQRQADPSHKITGSSKSDRRAYPSSAEPSPNQRLELPIQTGQKTSEQSTTMDVDGLTAAVSRLSTSSFQENMPAEISFGRRRTRACTLPPTPSRKNDGVKQGHLQ